MAHVTDKEYLQVITEQDPYLKWKHWHFSNENTPPSLYVTIAEFRTQPLTKWHSEKRGLKGWVTASHLSWPLSSVHTNPPSRTVPAARPPLPVCYFPAVLPWCVRGTPGSLQGCHTTHLDSYLFLGYCINEASASLSQTPQCIRWADPHVLLWQRSWAVFWGRCTHSTYRELSSRALHQRRSILPSHSSISLAHALSKSSM